MSDESEKDKPADGTVILSGGPPKLQPHAPAASAPSEEEGVPSPPVIKPREGTPAAPPSPPGSSAAATAPTPPATPQQPAPAKTPAPQQPAPPSAPSAPASSAPPSAGDDDEGDVTQVLSRSELPRESTVILAAPPPDLSTRKPATPAPPSPPPAAAAPPPNPAPAKASPPVEPVAAASRPPAAASKPVAAEPVVQPKTTPPRSTPDIEVASADDATRTIVMRSPDADTVHWDEPHSAWLSLERILPADHAGVVRIDKKVATVGRALDSDVRLFSASASRQHARIEQQSGAWILVPIEGRRVLVDDETVDGQIELQSGMRIAFGDDELVVADQEDPDEIEPEGRSGIRPELVALGMVATGLMLYAALRLLGYL